MTDYQGYYYVILKGRGIEIFSSTYLGTHALAHFKKLESAMRYRDRLISELEAKRKLRDEKKQTRA